MTDNEMKSWLAKMLKENLQLEIIEDFQPDCEGKSFTATIYFNGEKISETFFYTA